MDAEQKTRTRPQAVKNTPDFERFRLRRFVEELIEDGEVEIIDKHVERGHVAGHLDANPKVVYFKNVGPQGVELVGNVMGSRGRLAKAFGVGERDLVRVLNERLKKPFDPIEVPSELAPVHEVVLTGKDADFTKLPIHLQHGADGGPYLSATMDFTIDPETGWTNVGVRRHLIRGRRESGVDAVSPSDLRAIYIREAKKGNRLPVAFVIGCTSCDFIGATAMQPPCDELAILGAIRGAPVPVVRCITNDVLVPADAEYVIEGYLDERGHVEPEGPYGEFLGYYGPMKMNPTFHLTAVTHRRDALFQTVTQAGQSLKTTDVATICCARTESIIWNVMQSTIREPVAVYCTPASGGYFNVRLSMRQRYPGEVRNAISAALGSPADIKHIFVVDDDIDVFSDDDMEWALSTRFQADRDVVIVSDIRCYPLDPSLYGSRTGCKAGFDLTINREREENLNFTVALPPKLAGRAKSTVSAALKKGPLTFGDLMNAVGSVDGMDVVLELEKLRNAGKLTRKGDGRYALANGAARAAPAKRQRKTVRSTTRTTRKAPAP